MQPFQHEELIEQLVLLLFVMLLQETRPTFWILGAYLATHDLEIGRAARAAGFVFEIPLRLFSCAKPT